MVVTPQELAEQLTLIDFAIYSHIEVSGPRLNSIVAHDPK